MPVQETRDNDALVTSKLPITLTLGQWKMLGRYLVWLNRDRLDEKRKSQMGFGALMETFAKLMLVHQAAEAQRQFDDILLETYKRSIPGFWTSDELDSIATASSTELFSLLGLNQQNKTVKRRLEQRRALQGPGWRSKCDALRLPGKPGEVRRESLQLTPGFDGKSPRVQRSTARRKGTA